MAIIDHLVGHYGLGHATHAAIGGDSAGGQAVYLHVDAIRARLPAEAHVVGVPDSGFFRPVSYYGSGLEWLFGAMNSSFSLNTECLTDHKSAKDMFKCIYAETAVAYVQTPLFILQSQYDPAQPMDSHDPTFVTAYGHNLLSTLLATAIDSRPRNGAYIYMCVCVCVFVCGAIYT